MTSLIIHFPYIGFFVVLVLGGLGFPFPEGITLIICGFLMAANVVEPLPALFAVFSGVLTGDFLSYYIGRKYGRHVITSKRFKKILSPEKLTDLESKFNKIGIPFVLIVGRLISGTFLVAGIMGMSFIKFLVVDVISALIAIIIWFGIGYLGGYSLEVIKSGITRTGHIAALLFTVLTVISLLYIHLRSRKQGRMKP
jgi:membrane protein DedA with SNARE-associated domain